MRYLVDEHDMDEATSLATFRTLVSWAAERTDRFVLRLQRDAYDDPATVRKFAALGEVQDGSDAERSSAQSPRNRSGRAESMSHILEVRGAAGAALVAALTSESAPARANAGDTSPVEDLFLFTGERPVYASYDYGRTQVLDLADPELRELRATLESAGLNANVIVAAPRYVTGEQ